MNHNKYCIKCGSTTKALIHHHENYQEIHGYDKVVMLCRSCHIKLHIKIRREDKCPFTPAEINDMSKRASNQSTHHKKQLAAYNHKNTQQMNFYDNMESFGDIPETMPNVLLCDKLTYNSNTGNVSWTSNFMANNGKKLLYIDLE